MKKYYRNTLATFDRIPWMAGFFAWLAGIWYFLQAFRAAHFLESVLDEGAYLYKGYLFVSGQYTLYQPNGPWSNHMPLSFLIPGAVQVGIEPGLRTGRYFAILLSLLMILGVWLLVRRLAGKWWATTAVWILVWNPATAKMYSLALSQVLVASMLVWMLYLVMGKNRARWEILLGSIMAGLIVMTRINMLPILPILILYIFWQHGIKAGVLSTLAGGITVIIGHALYWPDILQMWARLPQSLTPFLDAWRIPKSARGLGRTWDPDVYLTDRVLSFFHTTRLHFAAIVGALSSWLLWPREKELGEESNLRDISFLSLLFVALMSAHMWAALGKEYCVYCLAGYTAFFSAIGVILAIITLHAWNKNPAIWKQVLIIITILFFSAGIGFAAFEDIAEDLMRVKIPQWLLGSSTPGFAELSAILINKFSLETAWLRRFLPSFFAFGLGAILLLGVFLSHLIVRRKFLNASHNKKSSYAYWALLTFFMAGIILSPTKLFAGRYEPTSCQGDIIQSYEKVGVHLAERIPAGAQVFWKGGLSVVPLLYIPEANVYPPQINNGYSYFNGGDPETLLKFSSWNEELARRWSQEADFILIEERSYKGWLRDVVTSDHFIEMESTPAVTGCRVDSQIRIFMRIDEITSN